ncbi:Uncharacterised protein [Ectopseudomonas oleovorans]|uniref:Uncharacterized protein n=1 Tax=Ectopseudomonas oleovorans TaxID=301 RepID=A0A379PM37_ECTOL|nr:Uncharacterised protein [Pseudomonas oleovorans]
MARQQPLELAKRLALRIRPLLPGLEQPQRQQANQKRSGAHQNERQTLPIEAAEPVLQQFQLLLALVPSTQRCQP